MIISKYNYWQGNNYHSNFFGSFLLNLLNILCETALNQLLLFLKWSYLLFFLKKLKVLRWYIASFGGNQNRMFNFQFQFALFLNRFINIVLSRKKSVSKNEEINLRYSTSLLVNIPVISVILERLKVNFSNLEWFVIWLGMIDNANDKTYSLIFYHNNPFWGSIKSIHYLKR